MPLLLKLCLAVGLILLLGCETVAKETNIGSGIERLVPAPEKSLEGHMKIIVHLPDAYETAEDQEYPVIYFLHGLGSDAGAWERLGGRDAMKAHDFIIVSVDAGASNFADWEDGEHLGQTLLTDHVVPYVDASFRTYATRKTRAIMGQSMGGNAALVIAMTRPDLFACAASHSAALQPIDFENLPDFARSYFEESEDFGRLYGEPFMPEAWARQTASFHAAMLEAETLKQVSYYFDVGVDDHLGFAERNTALSAELGAKGVPHVFGLREGGHNADFVRKNIPNALVHFQQCFASAVDDT